MGVICLHLLWSVHRACQVDGFANYKVLSSHYEVNRSSVGKTIWEPGSKYYKIAQNQNWLCPICGENLHNGEALETHHIVPLVKSGTDEIDNLQHLHKICHKTVHSGKRSVKAKA